MCPECFGRGIVLPARRRGVQPCATVVRSETVGSRIGIPRGPAAELRCSDQDGFAERLRFRTASTPTCECLDHGAAVEAPFDDQSRASPAIERRSTWPRARQLPIPNAQPPTTPNSQFPIVSCWALAIGSGW